MIITSARVVSEFNHIMRVHANDPSLSYIRIDQFIKYLQASDDKEIEDLILYYMVLMWYTGPLFSYLKKRKPVMITYSSRAKIQHGCNVREFSMCFNYLEKSLKIKSYVSGHYILIMDREERLIKIDLNKIRSDRMGDAIKNYLHGNI